MLCCPLWQAAPIQKIQDVNGETALSLLVRHRLKASDDTLEAIWRLSDRKIRGAAITITDP
jgi:hypothetical protein